MFTTEKIHSYFNEAYKQTTERNNGGFVPKQAAQYIADRVNPAKYQDIFRILRAPDCSMAVYPDARPFFQELRKRDESVIIWTQGEVINDEGLPGYQIQKFVSSKLGSELGGKAWKRKMAAIGFRRLVGGMDKIATVPFLYEQMKKNGLEQMVVIDDKADNLENVRKVLAGAALDLKLFQIDRSVDHTSLNGEIKVIKELADSSDFLNGLPADKRLYLLDLDYTAIDHAIVRRNLAESLGNLLTR